MSIRPLPEPSDPFTPEPSTPEPSTPEPSTPDPSAGVRTLRTPEDLLALVPTLFNFHPRDSLVLVGVGAAPGMHARVDLPVGAAAAAEVGRILTDAAQRAECRAACLVAYCADPVAARAAVSATSTVLAQAGIPVALAVHTDGPSYALLHADAPNGPRVTYDVRDHPLLAEAVLAGRVLHADRDDLVASLRPVPALVAEVERHAHAQVDALAAPEPGADTVAPEVMCERIHEEARWVSRMTRTLLAADATPTAEQAARMLVAMRVSLTARDALWVEIDRGRVGRAVTLCRHLVQVAPRDLRAAPAALLGFAGWLSGDGALAWCGVEASQDAEPGYSLAALIARLLEGAVPPASWVPMTRAELGVPGLD